MRINIKANNVRLDEAVNAWIYKKLGEIEKYLPDFSGEELEGGRETLELDVEIEKTTKHHRKGDVFRTEVQLYLPKELIRVEAVDQDLRTTINQAKDELHRKIKKYKKKRIVRARKWARKIKEIGRAHRILIKKDKKLSKLLHALKRKK